MREPVTPEQIEAALNDRDPVYFKNRNRDYRITKLHSNLIVPSQVHGYSLAIEYMRYWFVSRFERQFGKDFFKTVHINGKHVLDEYKHFNKQNIKREYPMAAIMPTIDYDYDRENIDLHMADPEIYLKRSNFNKSFFHDYQNNLHIGIEMRALRMNFAFKIRVRTKAQQIDLWRNMELMFRIGCTQKDFISADFQIPKEAIIDIAKKVGFDVDEKNKVVEDILPLLSYLNRNSDIPFMFKMRSINQQPEFFIRVRNLPLHIACSDKIQVDDGERDGHLDTNFHLEMAAILTIPTPYFYTYFSADDMIYRIDMTKDHNNIGLYSFCKWDPPMINKQGWQQIAMTSYLTDPGEREIDLGVIFKGNTNLNIVMEYCLKNHISPAGFLEIKVYRSEDKAKLVRTNMDFAHKVLYLLDEVEEECLNIVIYGDAEYLNDTMISLENYNKTRISREKLHAGPTNQTVDQ